MMIAKFILYIHALSRVYIVADAAYTASTLILYLIQLTINSEMNKELFLAHFSSKHELHESGVRI